MLAQAVQTVNTYWGAVLLFLVKGSPTILMFAARALLEQVRLVHPSGLSQKALRRAKSLRPFSWKSVHESYVWSAIGFSTAIIIGSLLPGKTLSSQALSAVFLLFLFQLIAFIGLLTMHRQQDANMINLAAAKSQNIDATKKRNLKFSRIVALCTGWPLTIVVIWDKLS